MNEKMDSTKRLERLLERYGNGDIDRRDFVSLLGCAALAAGVSSASLLASTRHAAAQVEQLRFDGWGGIVSEAFRKYAFDPYEEATGIKVIDGTFGSEEEHFTNVRASQEGEYNIHLSSGVVKYKQFTDAGYGVVLDESKIPNLKLVMNSLLEPFRKITPDGLSCVPFDYGTSGLAYNTNYISASDMETEGANILLSQDFKGKIGGYGDWQTRIWYGALQSGQDPNNIEDIDVVWEKIRENRGLILKYFSSGAELMDLLAKEEYIVCDAWSGRIAGLQEQGHPIGYHDPNGSYAWMEDLFVMKGTPLPEAEELLNYMLEPEVSIAVAEGQNYPSSLDPSKVEMPESVRKLPAFDPTGTLSALTFADPDFWTAHDAEWKKMWGRIEKGA
ncbi:MAG: extracellular solute-binding protein [Kiloniellales bacterium]|jgi:spermidine/putrescine transport system substrate-binding protein|nr:extracellular solute-binding protein [Kiloniellales bacterium]